MTEEPPPEGPPGPRPPRRPAPRRTRRRAANAWLGRGLAAGALATVLLLATLTIAGLPGGGHTSAHPSSKRPSRPTRTAKHSPGTAARAPSLAVPVLMYHVVASQPPGTPNPDMYVPQDQFSAQMHALKAAGWHAVTLDQLEAYWTRRRPLGPGKPIVLTFDTGYHSQYANALPVLQGLGWVGDENLLVNGISPSEGGITGGEVKALIAAGWEIDTEGLSYTDPATMGPGQLQADVATARTQLQQLYGVSVNWFSYPFGHYDPSVIAAVKAAGYAGATTAVAGLATNRTDPYTLPRLAVLPGTSPSALLAQIASAQTDSAPPSTYSGPGFA